MAGPDSAWHAITRLGEAQLLLPAMALMLAWLVLRHRAWRLAVAWCVCTAAAALLTTATKIAFIGYGIGHAPWDFTGLSGHAMFAAAVLPLLLRLAEGSLRPAWHHAGLAAGYALAALVAVSRVPVGAHSWSEVIGGFALGVAASAGTLRLAHAPRLRIGLALPLLLAGGLGLGVAQAPPSRTHDAVTRLSLALSGRATPWTRAMMQRAARATPPVPAPRAPSAAGERAGTAQTGTAQTGTAQTGASQAAAATAPRPAATSAPK